MADPINVENEQDDITANPFPSMDEMENVEEIVLGNEFDETASVIIPRKTNYEYTQISKFKGIKRSFKIFNDIYLHHSLESFRNKDDTETRINITFLDSVPTRQRHLPLNWLYSALATNTLGLFLIYLGEFSGFGIAHPYMLPVGIVLITSGLVCAMIFAYRTQDKMIYQSLIGHVPLIELFNKPKDSDYKSFVDTLATHILQAQKRQGLSMKQRLKGELSDLRRLSEEGEITVECYEQARSLIFKHKEYQ